MVGRTERDYRQDVLRFELRTLFFRMTVSQYTISVCCIFKISNLTNSFHKPTLTPPPFLSMAILIYQSRYRCIPKRSTPSSSHPLRKRKVCIARKCGLQPPVVHLSDFHQRMQQDSRQSVPGVPV